MKNPNKLLIILFIFLYCISPEENLTVIKQDESSSDQSSTNFLKTPLEQTKVLFIGSSYTATYDVPGMLSQLSSEAGKNIFVDKYAVGGRYLEQLANSSNAIAKIYQDTWDYVIFQV
jgi:hypothetical protein